MHRPDETAEGHMLTVILNDQVVVEYDRRNRLPGQQRRFFEQMDADMDAGIQLGEHHIENPDRSQRSYYVAMNLVRAVLNHNENLKTMTCGYLGLHDENLSKIIAQAGDEQVSMQLVYQVEE